MVVRDGPTHRNETEETPDTDRADPARRGLGRDGRVHCRDDPGRRPHRPMGLGLAWSARLVQALDDRPVAGTVSPGTPRGRPPCRREG